MAYTRKDYLGSRAETTLNGGINASTTSITITSATGWPTIANGGHYAVIDPDTTSEEKVLVTARTTTSLTVTRGVDGTTGVSHSSGATIRPSMSAVDFDEANYMVAETVGNITAAGDLLVGAGTNDLTRLAQGSASTILAVNSGGTLGYTTAATAMFADSAVTNAKLAGMTRGTVKVGNSSGVASDLALGTSGTYLTSDGADAGWGTPGEGTKVRKTADETSSGSSVNDAELRFAATANSVYYIEYAIAYAGTSTSPDLFLVFEDNTNAAQGNAPAHYYDDSPRIMPDSSLGQGAADLNLGAKNGTRVVYGSAVIIATGGTYYVRWVPNTTGSITLKAGSYLRYREIT